MIYEAQKVTATAAKSKKNQNSHFADNTARHIGHITPQEGGGERLFMQAEGEGINVRMCVCELS